MKKINTKFFAIDWREMILQTNVAGGLKLFEDVFTDLELSKLNDFVDELQVAGRNGELSGGSPCFVMLL